MRAVARIAIDTEGDSLHHYFEKVCLIQLTLTGETYIVDPLSGIDLSQFLRVLSGKALILHGGEYDLRMLKASTGFRPHNEVFDTMLAAQLLGHKQLGLAALAKQFFNVTLSKQGQKSDWSRRPLTQAQMRYAADDTRYLAPLADILSSELRKLGRRDWHQETCKAMIKSTALEKPRDPGDAWRIKGLSLLRPRQLAFVRQLWYWRENEARKADLPPFKIMGNQQMIVLAVWAASHPTPLNLEGPRLPRNCRGRRLKTLRNAILKAQRMPESKWPEPRRGRKDAALAENVSRSEVEALRAECSRLAAKLGIDASVLAPRASLVGVARKRPRTTKEIMAAGPLMRWQANLLKPGIRRILG
jgi:ribonuclease D